jgi:hypothetical protein
LLLDAAVCFVVAGAATRFGCQPINAMVDGWTLEAPPTNWQELRAEWWQNHLMRMSVGSLGYALVLVAALRPLP